MPTRPDYHAFLRSFGSERFRELRPAQSYMLDAYSRQFSEVRDIAVELPTGAGKTLIALLISEAWRQDAKKVAVLSANKTLARQMLQEAQHLRIPAVLMEGRGTAIPARDKRDYQRKVKVAIMNYWVYFNQSPVIDPADLLVMDDAHLAEHCLHSLYSVEISKHRHGSLFRSLVSELLARFPEYAILSDALADDIPPTSPPELLCFTDQVSAGQRIRELIDAAPELEADSDLGFRWGRLRNSLHEANMYLSLNSVWIRPYIYPLLNNTQYAQTTQRLYVSATIGDPSDLARRVGVHPISKIPVPPEHMAKTSGRRMVVMNRVEGSEDQVTERLGAVLSTALAVLPKSVWLCASESQAIRARAVVSTWLNANGFPGQPTWLLTALGDEIDQFKAAPQGHLFVAGRFDGMDFSAEECRLVVITNLPRAINAQEEFISAYLRDSEFMRRRLNQRVVQALGRCNRSDEDFGLYVLIDPRFATHFGRDSNRVGLPQNIMAEIDMAQDLAELDVPLLASKVSAFLRRDFAEYDAAFRTYLDGVPSPTEPATVVETSADEVLGWAKLFDSKSYPAAAEHFERCWNHTRSAALTEIGALHGWNWAKALYLQSTLGESGAKERALSTLDTSIQRGGRSAWFNRMRGALNRALNVESSPADTLSMAYETVLLRTFDDYLEKLGTAGDKFQRWCNAGAAKLQSASHAEFQEGLEGLGKLLGYTASRPRNQASTDCIWRGVFGNSREVITLEAKVEDEPSHEVAAGDVGQAHNQNTRAATEFGAQGYWVRSVIVTHLTSIAPAAEAAAGAIRIIQKSSVHALWERLVVLLSLYRQRWSLDDLAARVVAAQAISAHMPDTGWLIRAIDSSSRFIRQEEILSEWQ